HVAELLRREQVWVSGDWAGRFGLATADPGNTGYGHSPAQVRTIRPDGAEVLVGYYGAVAARTRELIGGLAGEGPDRGAGQGQAQVQRAARPVLRSGHDPSRFSSPTAARSSS